MCAVVSDSRSAAMRAGRRSPIGSDRKLFDESAQCQLVSVRAESADNCKCRIGEGRTTPLRLTRVDVRKMDFDEGDLYARQRIADGETGVAVRACVHERAISATTQRLHGIDDLALAVVLRERQLDPKLSRDAQEVFLDVGERLI